MPYTPTIKQQAERIQIRYPKARVEFYSAEGGTCLDAYLELQALPIYSKYRIRLRYLAGSSPFVEVVDPPPVTELNGKPTPHLNRDGSLCLFDPSKREWSAERMIADTTIPWVERWLLHYESWLSTGVWLGDTEAPATKPDQVPGTTELEPI